MPHPIATLVAALGLALLSLEGTAAEYRKTIETTTVTTVTTTITITSEDSPYLNTAAGASLRTAPDRGAKKRLLIHFGTLVQLLERQDQEGESWSRVATEDGEGWIPSRYLTPYQRAQALPLSLQVARNKLAVSQAFGDLVDVGNFLLALAEHDLRASGSRELQELTQTALQKAYAAIPADSRNASPYREWIQEQAERPGGFCRRNDPFSGAVRLACQTPRGGWEPID